MESYCNMNASNGRGCHDSMNQGYRNQMNRSGNRSAQNHSRQMMEKRSRTVEMECSCKMKSNSNCHQHDEMEKLGDSFPLVMAYVPWQQWGEMYEAEYGLMQGTIFKDLNFIFCGVRC